MGHDKNSQIYLGHFATEIIFHYLTTATLLPN